LVAKGVFRIVILSYLDLPAGIAREMRKGKT